jgi:prepilin-type N-terminal cleavage/methylation domain-containing protein
MKRKTRSTGGFTFIEVMISIAVLCVLVVGIYAAFEATQGMYATGISRQEIQDRVRRALNAIALELRQASAGTGAAITFGAEGFWCLGLAAEGAEPLAKADLSGRIAFVLGAEGAGLRRLTREYCDLLVRLPTRPGLIQLNVSNAAALALYERTRSASLEPREPDEA